MSWVSREDICQELRIDNYVLSQYEEFLELPEPINGSYDINIAKLVARLDELLKNGLSFNDVRQLSVCAEQYSEMIPALKSFRDFSPQHHLKELVNYYNQLVEELAFREEQYQTKIQDLETIIETMQIELEKNGIALDQIESYQREKESFREALEDREAFIEEVQMRVSQQEVRIHELEHENTQKADEIEKLKVELEFYMTQGMGSNKRTAVDIQALLKKKEKEVSLKFQREIFDLKKQVDLMMEQKEEEWLLRNKTNIMTS
jgi:chromosome segregation ATPase